ncbi:MXAN_5187 C-terminal domain-containing protein [Cystobacter fuscus]|uniref:MXAN_5187 C-terminal domain-containing protein n=1 Tax=Cystobacter fuscus TaxID=43 RepID=UPI002FC6C9ED
MAKRASAGASDLGHRRVTGRSSALDHLPGALSPAAARTVVHSGVPGCAGDLGHRQEVFREFVQTRDQCGEPQDGLTYDKFVAKLRKNREQLVQKYACKTVRFQVCVKEGRAALKATPVKD